MADIWKEIKEKSYRMGELREVQMAASMEMGQLNDEIRKMRKEAGGFLGTTDIDLQPMIDQAFAEIQPFLVKVSGVRKTPSQVPDNIIEEIHEAANDCLERVIQKKHLSASRAIGWDFNKMLNYTVVFWLEIIDNHERSPYGYREVTLRAVISPKAMNSAAEYNYLNEYGQEWI